MREGGLLRARFGESENREDCAKKMLKSQMVLVIRVGVGWEKSTRHSER